MLLVSPRPSACNNPRTDDALSLHFKLRSLLMFQRRLLPPPLHRKEFWNGKLLPDYTDSHLYSCHHEDLKSRIILNQLMQTKKSWLPLQKTGVQIIPRINFLHVFICVFYYYFEWITIWLWQSQVNILVRSQTFWWPSATNPY